MVYDKREFYVKQKKVKSLKKKVIFCGK